MSRVVSEIDMSKLAEIVASIGSKLEITRPDRGRYVLNAVVPVTVAVVLYGDPNYNAVQIRMIFVTDLSKEQELQALRIVNKWNHTKRRGKVFLDEDLDVSIERELELDGGVTEDRIRAFINSAHQVGTMFLFTSLNEINQLT